MPSRNEPRVTPASTADLELVRSLWREYWDALSFPMDFQGFADELQILPGKYAPPGGRLLLAWVNNEAAGTAALRPLTRDGCEAKRFYVRPPFRNRGLGRVLLGTLIEEARLIGYRDMYCDTLGSMTSALKMYADFGFAEVAPYSAKPTPGAVYLKLAL